MTRTPRALPGFAPALAVTTIWLGSIVLVPMLALAVRPWQFGAGEVFAALTRPRVLASLRLSFVQAALAGAINVPLGLLIAWVLVRDRFPGRRLLDALLDLPFALPTSVAGITLVTLYGPNGWLGAPLAGLGVRVAYTQLGILVAMVFVGLPFVVRTVQPVLQDLPAEQEEAAATLGARPGQILWRVLLPALRPALLAGFALALARAVGEYGSVIFIAGNKPMQTEITPLLVAIRLQEGNATGAAAIGLLMLVASALCLGLVAAGSRMRLRPG